MILLQSNDSFDELGKLNLDTGEISFLSKSQNPQASCTLIQGHYAKVGDSLVCLYRFDDVLYLRIGELQFEITDRVLCYLSRELNNRSFKLISDGKELVNVVYTPVKPEIPLNRDPTPFIEEEDFDFMLFIHNVINNFDRRHRIYR
jgi:hypothetical protein